jgi:hypothetical protein
MVIFPELSSKHILLLALVHDPDIDITEGLTESSVPEVPPTNIGDCLANVGDVGIRVSSSSSNFVWVHFELVPGK